MIKQYPLNCDNDAGEERVFLPEKKYGFNRHGQIKSPFLSVLCRIAACSKKQAGQVVSYLQASTLRFANTGCSDNRALQKGNKLIRYLSFCLMSSFFTQTAVAGSYQSHKSIYLVAKNFVHSQVVSQHNQQVKIKIGTLDSRLKLKQCHKPLQAFLPDGSRNLGKTTVGVKCNGKRPWSLHVPVTISVYKKVMVASRQLQKGSVLSASDIKLKNVDLASLHHGFFEELKSGSGKKLKRRISAGAVITPAMLKKPQLISRGQQITIMAQSGRMMVRMGGKALANGAVGERIKVMNLKSRKLLEGVITPSGEVKVDI